VGKAVIAIGHIMSASCFVPQQTRNPYAKKIHTELRVMLQRAVVCLTIVNSHSRGSKRKIRVKNVCVHCPRAPKGGRDDGYYYYAPMTYPCYQMDPRDMLARCSAKQGHRATRGSLLPQATWDGAQLCTSRSSPHHQVHASPAAHGIPLHQRHCQLLVCLTQESGALGALLGGVDGRHVQQHIHVCLLAFFR
jgi:hypothetical protein